MDCETTSSYALRVEAADSGSQSDTATVTITVTDVNEEPAFDANEYTFAVAENSAMGHSVGTVVATDPDDGATLTYSISGEAFGIYASGAITVGAALDHETTESYSLIVTVEDGGGLSDTATLSITVTDVNEAPSFDTAEYTFTLVENAVLGELLGNVSATDPEEGDTLTYTIEAGNTDNAFSIGSGTGIITVAAALDYETTSSYTLNVKVDDGNGGTDTATVTVSDMSEGLPPAPTELSVTLEDGTFTISWIALDGAVKYDAQHKTDATGPIWTRLPETRTLTQTYTPIGGPACGTTYQFRVRAYGDGNTYTVTWGFTSGVESVDTATCDPEFCQDSYTFFIRDTTTIESVLSTVSATYPDTDDTVRYSITGGNDDGKFSINSATGQLTLAGNLDIATTPTYSLAVEASDGKGGEDTARVTRSLTISACANGTVVPGHEERPRLVRDCSVLLTASGTRGA